MGVLQQKPLIFATPKGNLSLAKVMADICLR